MANNISLAKRTRGNYAGKCIVFNGTEFQLYLAQEKELDTTSITGVERVFLNAGSRRYKGDPMKVTVTYTYNLLTKGGQEGLLEDAKAWFKQLKDAKDYKKVQEALVNAEAEGKIETFELDPKFKIYSLYDVQPMVEAKDIAKTDDGKILCITKDGTIGTRDKLPLGTEMLPLYMVRSIIDSTTEAAKNLATMSYGEKFLAWQKGTWEPPKQAVGVNSFENLLASIRQNIPAQQVTPDGVKLPF